MTFEDVCMALVTFTDGEVAGLLVTNGGVLLT